MNKQKPVKRSTTTNDPLNREVYDHPAFGVIRLSNSHGGNVALLGSDLPHSDYITLEIAPAELHRSYGDNRVYGTRKPIIKVALTHASFQSLAQSIGSSQGTPVTIQKGPSSLNKEVVPFPDIEPLESSLDMSKAELEKMLKAQVGNAMSALSELSEAIQAKKTGKAVLELVQKAQNQISMLPTNLSSSLDFASESLDKTAKEAQANAQSSIQMRLQEIAISSINGDTSKLLMIENTAYTAEKKDDENE